MAIGDYSFTNILWSNGDHISTAKKLQEVANDQYLRDEGAGALVISAHGPVYTLPTIDGDDRLGVFLNGNIIFVTNTSNNVSKLNEPISDTGQYPLGLITLLMGCQKEGRAGGTEQFGRPYRFLKTQQHRYISVWANWRPSFVGVGMTLHDFNVIIHYDVI